MTIGKRRITGFALAALVYALDQLVKWLMIGPLQLHERGVIGLLPIFDLRWAENYGVSLGLLTAESDAMRWLLVALTAAIAVGVMVWMLREKAMGEIAALSLVLGGALGNIQDRVRYGFVVDYADLHFGTFRPFMIFNLADAAISIGVVIILARSFLSRDKRPEADEHPTKPASES
jgi:signal peptidase II